jgi:hypothetical protein
VFRPDEGEHKSGMIDTIVCPLCNKEMADFEAQFVNVPELLATRGKVGSDLVGAMSLLALLSFRTNNEIRISAEEMMNILPSDIEMLTFDDMMTGEKVYRFRRKSGG